MKIFSIKKIIRFLINYKLNFLLALPKTIYFNLYYFGLKNGMILPVILSKDVKLNKIKGIVLIKNEINTGMIRWGFTSVPISTQKEKSSWNVEGKIIFKGNVELGKGTKIAVGKHGLVEFGINFRITANSAISCLYKIIIGDDCLISWDVLIMDTDAHYIYDRDKSILNHNREIMIGNKVWIGCRCLILKGARISDGSILAANTILIKKINKKNVIIGGCDTRILKENITWGGTIV